MRLTLSDCRTTIARVLGVCSSDSRVADYLNEATQRLLNEGKWVGTYGRYKICTTGNESESIMTWPRQLETIETIAVSQYPAIIRNGWYQWVPTGPGTLTSESGIGNQMVDLGEAYTTSDIIPTGNPKKIRVVSEVAESGSAVILFQGTDINGNPIRTAPSGTYINGERISISAAGANSTQNFYSITGVQKPATNGPVRIFELDTVTAVTRQIAYYEADETRPVYRRSILPGLQDREGCDLCSDESLPQLDVVGKNRYIPVVNDTDWMLIGNLPALKLAVMAILKEENDLIGEANAYMYGGPVKGIDVVGAVPLLNKELAAWLGDGTANQIQIHNNNIFTGAVENLI